jgi:hypothetical protein
MRPKIRCDEESCKFFWNFEETKQGLKKTYPNTFFSVLRSGEQTKKTRSICVHARLFHLFYSTRQPTLSVLQVAILGRHGMTYV